MGFCTLLARRRLAVGYGDVSANNTDERVLSIFLMVAGVTVFGYTLMMVSIVLLDGDPRQESRKVKMLQVSRYMSEKSLGKAMK